MSGFHGRVLGRFTRGGKGKGGRDPHGDLRYPAIACPEGMVPRAGKKEKVMSWEREMRCRPKNGAGLSSALAPRWECSKG